ncbi:mitochondrial carrier protein-like protein rim2 [Rhizodiscina lignyota]|uniref:Mitochondrial carrier protein-like protein rim2 n=1 Tax=Rhizodiscina lignyota TaxID=1504668 RepID=A0A9P4IVJ3_9PEZI|nr:mitochondrial carrier protein-like protein rim2 [Rhizodiscina lignyota]
MTASSFPSATRQTLLQDAVKPGSLGGLQESSDGGASRGRAQAAVGQQPLKERRPWAHFVAGAAGGMAAATLTAPLDVLRTRLQSNFYQAHLTASRNARGIPHPSSMPFWRASILHIQETFQILFAIPKAEGARALFKGLGPNLVGVVPAKAIHFFIYDNSKTFFKSSFNNGQEGAVVTIPAAICAGIVTGTATNPIWVIKTRMQLDRAHAGNVIGNRRYNGVMDCIMKTLRQEGIAGMYRGLSASYLGISETTLQWVLYERGMRYLEARRAQIESSNNDWTAWDRAVVWGGPTFFGGASKLVATCATYPHEVVRTRLRQAPMEGGHLKYTGLMQCFNLVLKEEGVAALYGGLVSHVLRTVPSAAITYGTYHLVVSLLLSEK